MKRLLGVALGVGLILGCGASSRAATVDLFDWAINIDGTITTPADALPGGVNGAAFDFTTGLGTLSISLSDPGSHFVGLFVDHEIDEQINTFFNELGTVFGAPTAGQTWEIDEPGYVSGDIYTHFLVSGLDNTNAATAPDDVSMALGWNFVLAADETATLTFLLSGVEPTTGFYLKQIDPDSSASIYFSSSLGITAGVPDGGLTAVLLLLGGGAVFGARRWARR